MALNNDILQAIEIAVRTSGQPAVDALVQELVKAKAATAAYQAQLTAGAPLNAKAIEDLTRLATSQREATEMVEAAKRSLSGININTQAASRGFVELSQAVEDFTTGGPLGALNNVPGVVRAIGQSFNLASPQVAALEASISLLGTAAFIAYKNWDRLKKLLDDGLSPKLLEDIKAFQGQLKELTEKEWKTRIDVQDMTILKEKIDDATRAKAAYDAMGGPDKETKARGDAFTEAVREADREKVKRAISAAMGTPAESAETIALRKKLAEQDRYMASPEGRAVVMATGGAALAVQTYQRDSLAKQLENSQAVTRKNREMAIEKMLGEAGQGDEAARAEVERLFLENRDKFAAVGVGGKFGGEVVSGSKENFLSKEERERSDREQAKDASDRVAERKRREADQARLEAEVSRKQDEVLRIQKHQEAEDARKAEQDRKKREAAAKAQPAKDARDQRDFDKAEKQSIIDEYADVAQQRDGRINQAQAMQIGKRAEAWESKGADPEFALQQAYAEVVAMWQQATARLQRLEQFGQNAAGNARVMRRQQGNMAQRQPPQGNIILPLAGGIQ